MGAISVDTSSLDINRSYYDYLELSVSDYGQQKLEDKVEEIEVRETKEALDKMTASNTGSNTMWYIMGAVMLIGGGVLVALKKKGIL